MVGEYARATAATAAGLSLWITATAVSPEPDLGDPLGRPKYERCHPLASLWGRFDNSWVEQLSAETPENRERSRRAAGARDGGASNTAKRPVHNGHYIPVKPTPLKNPRLVIHSPAMADILGLSEEEVSSAAFLGLFSGDVDGALDGLVADDDAAPRTVEPVTWATPYALSIMGNRYTYNCPFKTGDGYGDGRAISIGEVTVPPDRADSPAAPRYELQLKGSGPTPFCRGADGRAVFRSSVREFLASEAMAALGVSTTRALSLIVSDGPDGDKVDRPWYSDGNVREVPRDDDPRLARYSPEQRRKLIADWKARSKSDPDVLVVEPCAIATRVSPSFVRVGHFDLYARRVVALQREGEEMDGWRGYDTATTEWRELEQMLWHACFREYPEECFRPHRDTNDVSSAAKCLLRNSMEDLSAMVAGWIRVGFAQGNFNADNCLVAGRTVDYGPFGFMDEFHPLFAKWTGSGDHFGFMNQPKAGYANFKVLVESVMPLIEAHDREGAGFADQFHHSILEEGDILFDRKVKEVLRVKMGFHQTDGSADKLWNTLEPLLLACRADWTVFWRQLYLVAREFPLSPRRTDSAEDYEGMMNLLSANEDYKEGSSPFYEPLDDGHRAEMLGWIENWRIALTASHSSNGESALLEQNDTAAQLEGRMRLANPKYTLREWMLVDAYTKASPPALKSSIFPADTGPSKGNESMIHELLALAQMPYDEGTDDQDEKYYRRAPDEALRAGGTAFMS